MKTALFVLTSGILAILLSSNVRAQAFVNDNDGLLDVGEAAGFPADPMSAFGFLDLYGKGIQDLDGTSLLTNVGELDLTSNQITSIESEDFDGLTNLDVLYLIDNQITSVESGDFDGLSNLQSLSLGNNQITSIESGAFAGLTNLIVLTLSRNQITSIESGTFDGLTNLQVLDLSFNPIKSIEDLSFLLGLEMLDRLTIDLSLFRRYASEFEAWDALIGKTLLVQVPEPTAFCLVMLGMSILSGLSLRPRRLKSVASRLPS